MRLRAFTLIEISVVILVIALLAAIVMPNLVRMKESRERREFYSRMNRFVSTARESAITENVTLAITLGSSGRSLVLVEEDVDGERERRSLEFPDGVETSVSDASGLGATGDWRLRFYPDGGADGGGLEFSDGGRIRSLQVSPDGSVRMADGPAEVRQQEKWQAGDYEKRLF
jgi:general secretion pathway protein H